MMIKLTRLDHRYLGVHDIDKQFGVMVVDGKPLTTLERPWVPSGKYPAGESCVSCVPSGEYSLIKAHSPKYGGDMFYLENRDLGVVLREEEKRQSWHRWGCMFHPANWVRQINGCVAAGITIAMIGDDMGVTESRKANTILHNYLDKQSDPRILISWR